MISCQNPGNHRSFLSPRIRSIHIALIGAICFFLFISHGSFGQTNDSTISEPALKPLPAPMQDFHFDFYYQRIESVEVAQNASGSTSGTSAQAQTVTGSEPSDKPIDLNQRAGNKAPADSLIEGTATKCSQDKEFTYHLSRTKITSEDQLLRLMGVGNDVSKLTDGQRALLEIYRESTDPQFIARMKYGFQDKVSVVLADTSGFTGDNIRRDFWPCSYGDMIQFSADYFSYANSADTAKSVFVHESAHTLDKTWLEYDKPYGLDGSHYVNEFDKPKAAFIEGWAEYAQFLHFPEEASFSRQILSYVRIESDTVPGSYTQVPSSSLSGADLLRVEGINAWILLRIARGTTNGPDKVLQSFSASNAHERTIADVLRDFVTRFPDDAIVAAQALDTETLGKLSDDQMIAMLGNSPAIAEFLVQRRAAAEAARLAAIAETERLASEAAALAEAERLASEAARLAAIAKAERLASEAARIAAAKAAKKTSSSKKVNVTATSKPKTKPGQKVEVKKAGASPFSE
ncbi:MAG: hypothetical protein HQM09_15495 [Candidatus Riflebacteria bacterium]|nr:hypothetical protein [Candidatus Riflebacteria bacterium]